MSAKREASGASFVNIVRVKKLLYTAENSKNVANLIHENILKWDIRFPRFSFCKYIQLTIKVVVMWIKLLKKQMYSV